MARVVRAGAFVFGLMFLIPGPALVSWAQPVALPTDAPALQPLTVSQATTLRMKAGAFDPLTDEAPGPAALHAPVLSATADFGGDGKVRFILQFDGGVNADLLDGLRARGVDYERYLPDGGMIAAALPRALPLSAAEVGARALIALHPAFKLAPDLWDDAVDGGAGRLRVAVLVFSGFEAEPTLEKAGDVLAFDGRMAIVDTTAGALLGLARSSDIEWVEPYSAPSPMLDILTRTIGARQAGNGSFVPGTGLAVWSYNQLTNTFEGLNGSGVTINIADTGVDGTHPTFAGRIVAGFGYGDNATCDCSGFPHGTHVAGIAAGNGSWRANDTDREQAKYAGVAPGASIVAQMIFNSVRTPAQYSQDAYSAGAFVDSNSWAATGGGAYTSLSEEYDALVVDANGRDAGTPQMVYVFSAGNSGQDYDTGAPSTGKNVISAGATGNGRGTPTDQVAGFSSRGPAADGRLKPDLVAPGEAIDSARAQSAGCGGGEDNCSYWMLSGTSMSAPAISGAAALVTQGYGVIYRTLPSAAMVKGLLIAGATALPGYPWPDPRQGWGLINVARSIDNPVGFRHLVWDEGVALAQAAGRNTTAVRFFANGGGELKVVLQWSDVPGTASSSKTLINDLDLEVEAPDGHTYRGNLFADGFSVNGTTADRGNNTEVLRIANAARGAWTVRVRAAAIPSGDQQFALIATGDITDRWVSLAPNPVEFIPVSPREDDPLVVVVPVFNAGTVFSAGFDVVASFEGPEGSATQTAHVLEVRPGDDFPATFTFAPKRGPHTLTVAVDPGGTSRDEDPRDNAASGSVFVAGFEPEAHVVRNITWLIPLASDTFLVEVANRGNVRDQLALGATADAGWTVALNATAVQLDPGESRVVSGTVTAPDRAPGGASGHVLFQAASGGNASRTAAAAMEIAVQGAPASRVSQGAISHDALPGETVSFAYGVENAGNVPLHLAFAAGFAVLPPAGFDVALGAANATVDAYSSFSGNMTVRVPSDALASAYRTLILTVTSSEEGTATDLVYQLSVRRVANFSIVEGPPFLEGLPGATLRFPVHVENGGNARETFVVTATAGGPAPARVQYAVENATLVVPPHASGFATVEAYVRRTAATGEFAALVEVKPASGASATTTLRGQVQAVHAVDASAPATAVVRAGSSSVFSVALGNSGNSPEQLALLVAELPSGLNVSGWAGTLLLAQGTDTSLTVRVDASAAATLGARTLKLEVRPAAGSPFPPLAIEVEVEVRAPTSSAASSTPGFSPVGAAAALTCAAALFAIGRRRP